MLKIKAKDKLKKPPLVLTPLGLLLAACGAGGSG
tara:strand:+ start:133 stop:234 length:102 start_codon:yes stop_codon:yes gene_type:complete